jgi:hypothetical protein
VDSERIDSGRVGILNQLVVDVDIRRGVLTNTTDPDNINIPSCFVE